MASGEWSSGIAAVTGTVASAKTALYVTAPSAGGFELLAISFSTDGAQVGQYLLELVQGDATSAGTPTNTVTPTATGQSRHTASLAFGGTVHNTYTAEPTVLVPIKSWYIVAGGTWEYRWPLGEREYAAVGKSLGLRVTPPGTTSSVHRTEMTFED